MAHDAPAFKRDRESVIRLVLEALDRLAKQRGDTFKLSSAQVLVDEVDTAARSGGAHIPTRSTIYRALQDIARGESPIETDWMISKTESGANLYSRVGGTTLVKGRVSSNGLLHRLDKLVAELDQLKADNLRLRNEIRTMSLERAREVREFNKVRAELERAHKVLARVS